MDNHYHMLIRTNHLKLEKLMRGLNGGYAQYYNKKYKRNGYLFQNRFKSVLCQDQKYSAELIKYINLNPLSAGKVKSLEELKAYTWCGHGFLLGSHTYHPKVARVRHKVASQSWRPKVENYVSLPTGMDITPEIENVKFINKPIIKPLFCEIMKILFIKMQPFITSRLFSDPKCPRGESVINHSITSGEVKIRSSQSACF